jgi:cell division protein FtsN
MARHNRNLRRKGSAPGWVWMVFGFALGLVVAAGAYFSRSPTARAPGSSAPEAAAKSPPTPASRSARQSERTKTAAARDANGPQFDFYEVLPQYEVVVPEVETAASPAARAKPVEEPGSYVLQAGSFSALDDADRLKANLALLGIESRIQRVTIDDDTFHRVRIGPINDLDRLNRIRRQLRDADIDTLLMKVP